MFLNITVTMHDFCIIKKIEELKMLISITIIVHPKKMLMCTPENQNQQTHRYIYVPHVYNYCSLFQNITSSNYIHVPAPL
jgi:hypothetical protein